MSTSILWLQPNLSKFNGTAVFTYEVSVRLKNIFGFSVEVAGEVVADNVKTRFNKSGIKIHSVIGKTSNSINYWLLLPYYIARNIRKIRKLLDIGKYGVVIAGHFPMNYVMSKMDRPYLQYCFEPYARFYDTNLLKRMFVIKSLFFRLMSLFYRGMDKEGTVKALKILTLSRQTANWIHEIYDRDSEITYEGVDADFFRKQDTASIREEYGFSPLIFHSTDFSAIKGSWELLREFRDVCREIKNCKLLISNIIDDKSELKRMKRFIREENIAGNVEFLGFIQRSKLKLYYSAADIVVQPSMYQSMSLSLKEAMACEAAVIAGPHSEEVIDGKTGRIADTRQRGRLAKIIAELLTNENLRNRLGRNAREEVLSRFTWEAVTEKIAKTMGDVHVMGKR